MGAFILQAAAVPVRAGRLCLVTSKDGQRWGIPKGHLEPGKSLQEIALQEAWEEAGLSGELWPEPIGVYEYAKWGGTYRVSVFVLEVTAEAQSWPEAGQRHRTWLLPHQAIGSISRPQLRRLLKQTLADQRLPALAS
jgi:8-oxo-dGTP pyrophosphatase MutT (NUDIX family)